jgi:hypothetical protein
MTSDSGLLLKGKRGFIHRSVRAEHVAKVVRRLLRNLKG